MEGELLKTGEFRESLRNVKIIICDVEGTTTSIPFVRNILKSYFKDNLKKYITENWNDEEVVNVLHEMKVECGISSSSTVDFVANYVLQNIDSKQAPHFLKLLQAKIWEEGYLSNKIKGHLFPDVIPAFKTWTDQGVCVYLYSSGIELAQKLLFTYSVEGDVHALISGFFDLAVGLKVQPESYERIMEKLSCQPVHAAFLTDSVQEAEAARKAGLITVLVHREGNEPLDNKYKKLFPMVYSFEEVTSLLSKRKVLVDNESDVRNNKKKAKPDEGEDASTRDKD